MASGSQPDSTNSPSENLSQEEQLDKAQKELSEAQKDLKDLTKEKDHTQKVYDKHNKRHAESQDESDHESEAVELGFLEEIKPYLDELEEEWDKAQEHVQQLIDLINSLS